MYHTEKRNEEKPVGRRDNCQINDINTERKKKTLTPPGCLSVNYLVEEVG